MDLDSGERYLPQEYRLENELVRHVYRTLRPVALGGAIVYLLLSISHPYALPWSIAKWMTPVAGLTAAAYATLYYLLIRQRISPAQPYGPALFAYSICALNTFLHLALTGAPDETTNFMLLLIAGGYVFVSRGWFLTVISSTILCWSIAAIWSGAFSVEAWKHFGFAIALSTAISTMLNAALLSSLRVLVASRNSEQDKNRSLEEALSDAEDSRDKVESILQAVSDGILFTTPDGKISLANPSAERLIGDPLTSSIGRNMKQVLKAPALLSLIQDALSQNSVAQAEFTVCHPDEPNTIVQAKSSYVKSSRQNELGVVTSIVDISEAKEMEAMRTEFMAMAAHELRTPLTSILGFAELLQAREFEPAARQRYLEMIVQQANLLRTIIDDILNLERLYETHELSISAEPIEVGKFLQEIVEPFQDTHGADRISVEYPQETLMLRGDRMRIAQVLVNLISNALKYSPRSSPVTLRLNRSDSFLEFSVTDQGRGISVREQPRIFDRFFRSREVRGKVQGTGLGLSISKRIVALHGGELSFSSQKEVGSTFVARFPLGGPPS